MLNIVAPIVNQEENRDVSVSKKLMFTIWTLAKPESFLAVGDRFGLAKSTGYQIFTNVINALTQLMPIYVRWSTAEQCYVSCDVCCFIKIIIFFTLKIFYIIIIRQV